MLKISIVLRCWVKSTTLLEKERFSNRQKNKKTQLNRPHIVVSKRLSKINAAILTNLFPTGLPQFKVMGQRFNVMRQ